MATFVSTLNGFGAVAPCRFFEVLERVPSGRVSMAWERVGIFASEADARAAIERHKRWIKDTFPQDMVFGPFSIKELKISKELKKPERWWINDFKKKGV